MNYRFTIINFSKPSSLYNNGLRPLMYSTQLAEKRGKGWIRNGENIRYYRRAIPTASGRSQYCLTWTMKFPHNDDTVYLAHDYPYTYTDLQQYLDTLTNDTSKSRFIKTRNRWIGWRKSQYNYFFNKNGFDSSQKKEFYAEVLPRTLFIFLR